MNADIVAEYNRSREEVGEADPYRFGDALGLHDVLKAHFLIANYFYEAGSGLGGVGPRDINLLHSALHRQHVAFGPNRKWKSRTEIASTLFYGLIKDHPFHDANKRTAFLTLLYHLQLFRLTPTVAQRDLENLTVDIADNRLSKFKRYNELTRKSEDPEVEFIAHFLRRNTREIDKRYYIITYRQLKGILNRFGYDLVNPLGNTIDVVKIGEGRSSFHGDDWPVGSRVTQVGFPGWSSQVNQGAIATVRKQTKLTYEDGVDSTTFFRDEEPIDCLIAEYNEPLKRLAER